MTSKDSYLQELLSRYQANFDIKENFILGDRTYPAYAWFYSFSEKYVLKKEAQLWAIKAYEHVLFIKEEELSESTLEDLMNIIENHAEPELVRNNNKYPGKDHMCSYLTFVILTSKAPDEKLARMLKKFRYDKGYMFNFRGHCEARLAVVCMDTEDIITNYCGRELKELLTDIFQKAEKIAS